MATVKKVVRKKKIEERAPVDKLEQFRRDLQTKNPRSLVSWISPEGDIFPFGPGISHANIAAEILRLLPNSECSPEAIAAGEGAGWSDWTACEPNELIRRGWTRQRECWFTVRDFSRKIMERVFYGAERSNCGFETKGEDIQVCTYMDCRLPWKFFAKPKDLLDYG